jgi:spermidine/putrescine-binding protein
LDFRKDLLVHYGGHHITDWGDLLQPKLKGRLAFVDSPRELLSAALKSLGLSINASAEQMQAVGITASKLKVGRGWGMRDGVAQGCRAGRKHEHADVVHAACPADYCCDTL